MVVVAASFCDEAGKSHQSILKYDSETGKQMYLSISNNTKKLQRCEVNLLPPDAWMFNCITSLITSQEDQCQYQESLCISTAEADKNVKHHNETILLYFKCTCWHVKQWSSTETLWFLAWMCLEAFGECLCRSGWCMKLITRELMIYLNSYFDFCNLWYTAYELYSVMRLLTHIQNHFPLCCSQQILFISSITVGITCSHQDIGA